MKKWDVKNTVDNCKTSRKLVAEKVANILSINKKLSETDFCHKLHILQKECKSLWPEGWYQPPRHGISALFCKAINPKRLLYDNLRKPKFAAKKNLFFTQNSLGFLYASPVNKASAAIGDYGLTIYNGIDPKIKLHMKKCLEVVEKTAKYAKVGMRFSELHKYFQGLIKKQGLNNFRTITFTDKSKTNIGHTVPWSYENPSSAEQKIIQGKNFKKLLNLISQKRIHINKYENFKIPPTIAFTCEARLESNNNPKLPNVFFHTIVIFKNGKKEILENFSIVFKKVKMDSWIRSIN